MVQKTTAEIIEAQGVEPFERILVLVLGAGGQWHYFVDDQDGLCIVGRQYGTWEREETIELAKSRFFITRVKGEKE